MWPSFNSLKGCFDLLKRVLYSARMGSCFSRVIDHSPPQCSPPGNLDRFNWSWFCVIVFVDAADDDSFGERTEDLVASSWRTEQSALGGYEVYVWADLVTAVVADRALRVFVRCDWSASDPEVEQRLLVPLRVNFSAVRLEAWCSFLVECQFVLAVVGSSAACFVAGVHVFVLLTLWGHGSGVFLPAYSSCGKGPRSATSHFRHCIRPSFPLKRLKVFRSQRGHDLGQSGAGPGL